jgi:hypothetical protein
MTIGSAASAFLIDAGAVVGGGATLGGVAGFLGWLISEPVLGILQRRRYSYEDVEHDRLGVFLGVGAGIGGICGFLIWLYDHQGVI